ncbi:MAG TPA: PA2169 family four-helix-bundle protein [Chitinophagaceae bacterium]|nr:PA2169 family four-helix-bundle protein [Chitinophagaceae bacterium]
MKKEEILNDLLQINNDRIAGYEKAATQTSDKKLTSVFTDMSKQSREIATELTQVIKAEGNEPAEGTSASGKIYRAWMDVRNAFNGENPKKLLAACEYGEDKAQEAYKTALGDDSLSGTLKSLVKNQKDTLKESHDKIKHLRDTQPA